MDARSDYVTVCARSAEFDPSRGSADPVGGISADAAGGASLSVGVDSPEGIRAELNASAISSSLSPAKSKQFAQLPSVDSPLESEDLSASNSQAASSRVSSR